MLSAAADGVDYLRLQELENGVCAFCGGQEGVRLAARDDGALAIAICAACRAALSTDSESLDTLQEPSYSEAAKRVMEEAAAMTEESFGEKYLSDTVDRIIFEYVRGYGQTVLDGSAMGLISIMTEQGAEIVASHIEELVKKGLLYPVQGKPDWYGADYPFADD